MSARLVSCLSLGLLALLLPACAPGATLATDPDPADQDALVREDLGGQLPAFDAQIGELARRHGLADASELRALRAETDELGITHVRVQQTLRGVPVFEGEAIVHLDAATGARRATDKLRDVIDLDTTPALDATEAEDRALEEEPGSSLIGDPSTLFVLQRDGEAHLVWRVDTEVSDAAGALIARPRLFIDAQSGDVVWSYDNMQTATNTTRYDGSQSFDTTWTPYPGTSVYVHFLRTADVDTRTFINGTSSAYLLWDFDDNWSDSPSLDGISAHWAAGETIDYLWASEAWDGYDNKGSTIQVYTDYASGWNNAVGGGGGVWFGDGDGSSWSPFTSVDVVAHEIGHNVTEKMAALTYSGESGGMNESFSDLMGVMVERQVDGGSANNWTIMEDNYTPSTSGDAGRYMGDPAKDGASADYYTSASAIGALDVHYSSGIGNLAFSLLANGGYHPRRSSTYTNGVGPDAAMWIAFRAYRYYLTSGSDYTDLREAMTLAAADGYGATSWVVGSVASAFDAVGVGTTGCETGVLEGAGYGDILPGGTYFYSPGGALTAEMVPTTGTNVALYLYKWNGSGWAYQTGSASGSGKQSVSTTGSAGYYLWYAYALSGAANYSFCRS